MMNSELTVQVRGLRCTTARNQRTGNFEDLRPGEVMTVSAVDAETLIFYDAAELIDPADASRVAEAARRQQERITSRAYAETFRGR